ncbi:MAG: hypothetical protein JJ971_08810 [Balneolaceae bacterium]|nr:hypothetical protein [Balneolaceae bacterium]MBO6546659.1 hypothetical protein [Balneolaceae bacterium]MBO6649017.1 hypothetical protein [Balneolaceae bacterium]
MTIDGVEFYKISNYDQMPPFFISVVSDSDHWLYISTKGGLSAGRKNPENALFPYYTDDKIHDGSDITGSKTIMLVNTSDETYLWEPFAERFEGVYSIERNIYKSIAGNQLIFEEINHDLNLSFTYSWNSSRKYGFVKKSTLNNLSESDVKIRLLDGLQNLLPYGIDRRMQNEYSTLLDAYKKNELQTDSGLGLYLLSAIPVDKAEPSESLKATTVWSHGIEVNNYLLSSDQLDDFRKGKHTQQEVDVRARRGAYFLESEIHLPSMQNKQWYFVAELNQGPSAVVELNDWLQKESNIPSLLESDIKAGTKRLTHIVANADGFQKSGNKMMDARHFANVMFNVMRGGIFENNYQVQIKDLKAFLKGFNKLITAKYDEALNNLPEEISYSDLLELVENQNDAQLKRLILEYLPLTFSRRHGDPSRPWNHFSIELREENGDKKLYYAGNWRDIFQNWEALALSYPNYLEGIISKFMNASTADGYNPYRITRDGIDWEVIEEDDPWSYIGYWGDHQIIYLLKLLELSQAHHPKALSNMLTQANFAYANVPYRIKGYADILKDPKDTVDFDHHVEALTKERTYKVGADGKLIWDKNNDVYLVNLTEKLLVTLLTKLSNFIPEAGIWLNTQRPEWNDANNALVGNGVSMVTLFYIRRYVTFCKELFSKVESSEFNVSEEVARLFGSINTTLDNYSSNLSGSISDELRRNIVDELGKAGEAYRNRVYKGFSEEQNTISLTDLDSFFDIVLKHVDHTIEANKRNDNLYHSYNLMSVRPDGGIGIRYLYEMLEGQVAVLSSGKLGSSEVIEVLKALRNSALYREDQHSYILYPNRQLPRFFEKNTIAKSDVESSKLLASMIEDGDNRLVEKDVNGNYHFNGSFNNVKDLIDVLASLEGNYVNLAEDEKEHILNAFESVFDHQSFTGRSGTFFGYEGLGSIYWHMVSKLILAVEENCWDAINSGDENEQVRELIELYYEVREGLGTHKTPENYGAFPSDPYSHTPDNAGAKQPGMTGQVKEDILSRFGELGVYVEEGQLKIRSGLLKESEFLTSKDTFSYIDIYGNENRLSLEAGTLAFTYCQVPFIYKLDGEKSIRVFFMDGNKTELDKLSMTKELSSKLMNRAGEIKKIEIGISAI